MPEGLFCFHGSVGLDVNDHLVAVVALGQVKGVVILRDVDYVVGDQIAVAHIEELSAAVSAPVLALEAALLQHCFVVGKEEGVDGGREGAAGGLLSLGAAVMDGRFF